MTIIEVLEQVRELVRGNGRITYRMLRLQFNLDGESSLEKEAASHGPRQIPFLKALLGTGLIHAHARLGVDGPLRKRRNFLDK